ncbi:MAG: penicillin-binding protein [Clostridia bacterium]|nr:penicillin-binding protein [Clostridia bacterium]
MRKKTQTSKRRMSPKKKKEFTLLKGIFLIGVMTCVIICCYVLTDMISTVNGERIIDLEYYQENQDQTTIIYAKNEKDDWVELTKLHGEKNRIWVELDDIPDYMSKAFIAIEDKRFNDHMGVDWFSMTLGIGKSAVQALVSEDKSVRGASTLTQQLIKNLTGENGRNINRKYNELLAALNLEKYYEKDDILEAYLNTIYLSHNCYGVQTAAETYFGKDVSELNLAECAAIAVITQTPAKNDPLWQPENNKNRQEWCLGKMLEEGMITEEEYEEAINYELILTNSDKYVADDKAEVETITDNDIQSYYVDYVISSVIRDLKEQGYSNYEATRMIYSGGLHIYSAVDTEIQKIVEDVYVYRSGFPSEVVNSSSELSQSAMTIMDYSGRIVAMVGGAGEKTENRSNNRAVAAIRQPGSSIKPLAIYAPAIEEDYITWSSKIMNYGISWQGSIWPTNYGGVTGSPDSFVTAQYAVAISYNTVPAQILMKMGFKLSYDYLKNTFKISTYDDKLDSATPSALATGGSTGGVTTLEMAAAFSSFGNGGKYYEPYCYYEVKDNKGEVILQKKADDDYEQIISPETAYVMNQMLQTVFYGSGGTARGYAVANHRTFGKTGTTTSNKDRWCVAGTCHYIAAVWFGYDYNKQITASGSPAGQIFENVMNKIHEDLPQKDFEKYTDDVVKLSYCTGSGLIASDTCGSTSYGWYKRSNIPAKCKGNCGGGSEEESTTKPGTTEKPDTTKPGTSEPSSSKPNESTTLPVPPIVVPEIPSEVVSALQQIPRTN